MTDHEKSRNHYEKSGIYDPNMEHFEECEVNSGAWVLVTCLLYTSPSPRDTR